MLIADLKGIFNEQLLLVRVTRFCKRDRREGAQICHPDVVGIDGKNIPGVSQENVGDDFDVTEVALVNQFVTRSLHQDRGKSFLVPLASHGLP